MRKAILAGTPFLVTLLATSAAFAEEGHAAADLGRTLNPATVIPFVGLLLSIAVFPLAFPHWWEHNRNKGILAFLWAAPIAVFLIAKDYHPLVHSAEEYFSFIVLLGSLFVVAGGIWIRGTLVGTPVLNATILLIGSVLASFVGTTGASMFLIRPVIRANKHRAHKAHIVIFFIFLVSNIGGSLTPLGDPPLFLGFLRGVPFQWCFDRLWPLWLTESALVLVIFFLFDAYFFKKDGSPAATGEKEPLSVEGGINFLFLAGIVAAAFCSGFFHWPHGAQEGLMILMGVLSLVFTSKAAREGNGFSWGPIVEVAVLFAGIFVTMVPALLILNARGGELGLAQPWQFFWASGILSSFLDNAPTYLTYASTASGVVGTDANNLLELTKNADGDALLRAVAAGSVFMGANTYIGNGPNFMVKAIAEESGVKMPSFFGYMGWSVAILIPTFIALTFLFF